MTDFTSVSIRPPKDWQAFERHSRLLFEYVLSDPSTQNNGRSGQRQYGVDVFGGRGGGAGPLVGIQCKGKDGDYGEVVTEAELRREVKKTEKFRPELKEFILITTAPNDAGIQEKARLLALEVRAAGRDLSISVWGWERVQQEINRYGEVLKAFHPDATPFTDVLLDAAARTRQDSAQIKEMLAAERKASEERFKLLESRLPVTQISSADAPIANDPVDRLLNDQIDTFRDLIREQRPKTALALLTSLREKSWATASDKIRFRILGNLGSAHYNLGEYKKAADFFIEAHPYNTGVAISFANKIAGLLITGHRAEARQLAKDAVEKFPDSFDLALQRLQAREDDEDVEQLWSDLPAHVRDRPELTLLRITALRAADNLQWRKLAESAVTAPPVEEMLKMIRAEAVLDRILTGDRSALGGETGDVPDQVEIEQAATVLDELWQKSLKRETPPNLGAAHNGALAYNILGRREDARRLLNEALKLPDATDETKRLRLSLYPRNGPLEDAIQLADTLSDTPQNIIIRAELRVHDRPSEARVHLSGRESFVNDIEVMGASWVVVDSYLAEENFGAALAEAERLKARYPDDAQSYLTIYRVKKASAAPDAATYLDQAFSKITDGVDFVSRFMVADELAQAERWDDVIRLLRPCTSKHFDSPSLRALIAAAANGDRREVLKSVLDELPAEVAKRPFYRRSRVALAIRVQDIKAAEEEIRQCLMESPRNLEMRLQLMHALFRQGKLAELRAEAAKPASAFDGEPIDFVKLAQFKDGFGDWREAHALAYRTLLGNFEDAEVNMAYVGVFFQPGNSIGLEVEPATVAVDMAVTLAVESEPPKVFIVEPDPALRPTALYVAPTHPIAKAFLGRAMGEKVRLPDDTEATITFIKPKVLHALHEVLDNFQRLFPDSDGLERVTIDTSQQGGLGEIAERLQRRQLAIEEVFRTYESGLVPVACVARILGKGTVETFIAIAQSGRNVRVCEGTQQERDAAVAACVANERRGCVLDPISLHLVRRLDLERALTEVCGPISTVENRVLRLTQQIYELEQNLNQPDLSLSWSNGQTYRHEVSPEEKRQALDGLRSDRDWMRSNLEVLPAHGAGDPPVELNELTARFGSSFLDEARAAQGSGRLFVCEDQTLRLLGASGFKLPTTWLQPILMLAKEKKHITTDEYRKAIVSLIDVRLHFISVDSQLLVGSLGLATSLALPKDFSTLASSLGGAKADLASHVNVTFEAIRQFWNNRSLPQTLRQAAVGRLLENLCRERTLEHVHLIIRGFSHFNRQILRDAEFQSYLAGWIRGHFIPLE